MQRVRHACANAAFKASRSYSHAASLGDGVIPELKLTPANVWICDIYLHLAVSFPFFTRVLFWLQPTSFGHKEEECLSHGSIRAKPKDGLISNILW